MRELLGLRYRRVVKDNPDLIEAIRDKLPFATLDEANAFYKDLVGPPETT